MTENRRKIEVAVISDVHLGTIGSHAKALNKYLKSIEPEILIINGDFIDIWQFSKRYWPVSHTRVLKQVLKLLQQGTRVYYITGNHDEMLRKFAGFDLGNFSLVNQLHLNLNGKKTWFFHGDVFDICMKNSRWLAKLGAIGYDTLILLNKSVNFFYRRIYGKPISLAGKIKAGVKSAVKFISDFESTMVEMAASRGYDTVVCGHIHQPEKRWIIQGEKQLLYLNSGDWIENLTALEYLNGNWEVFHFVSAESTLEAESEEEYKKIKPKELFAELLSEMNMAAGI